MMKKLTLSAVLALVAVVVTATSADAAVTVSGNGINSINRVRMNSRVTQLLDQRNNMNATNVATTDVNTGNNDVSGTTGGDVNTTSGVAYTDALVANDGGVNRDNSTDCGCVSPTAPDVKIMGNGQNSENTVRLSSRMRSDINQTNTTSVTNVLSTTANTGRNDVSGTTGGSVTVKSGNATTYASIINTGNSNVNN